MEHRLPSPPIEVGCPICGADEKTWLHEAIDRWMGGPGTFRYARCRACGHVYLGLRPDPVDMWRYYPPSYIPRGRAPAVVRKALRTHDLSPRVDLVRRWTRRPDGRIGRLLDIGCATGDFLIECRSVGIVVAGVEPTPWAAAEAMGRGLPIWSSDVSGAALPEGAFDAVTLWDVVEHLERPVEDLRAIARTLRPGGHLIVGTPVEDGWEARLWGERWAGWDTPRHLSVFSEDGLVAFLRAGGFDLVWKGWVHESYLISAMSIGQIAHALLPAPVASLVRDLVHARPLRELVRPVFRALDWRLGGCALTVVAQRRADAR